MGRCKLGFGEGEFGNWGLERMGYSDAMLESEMEWMYLHWLKPGIYTPINRW